jgi:hypothetical protein
MGMRLAPALQETLETLDPDLRGPAHAIGMSLGTQLGRLRPALSHGADPAVPPEVEVLSLALAPEGEPDAISLAACQAAHQSYVASRGAASATSLGALAIARLLVWAQRAALLGAPPEITWIGPVQRRPADASGIEIHASCVALVDGARHTAKAVALVQPPAR